MSNHIKPKPSEQDCFVMVGKCNQCDASASMSDWGSTPGNQRPVCPACGCINNPCKKASKWVHKVRDEVPVIYNFYVFKWRTTKKISWGEWEVGGAG
jgi:hypothetical protein